MTYTRHDRDTAQRFTDVGAKAEVDAALCQAVTAIDHGEFFRSGR